MRLRDQPPVHLTYCLNIHPGETWAENFAAIRDKAAAVRDRLAPPGPFGLGLRLGEAAARELLAEGRLAELREVLRREEMYAFTVNGFPYGRFHGTAVKAEVYSPDWRSPQRLDYTVALARILAELLPEAVPGSISTVPGSYKAWVRSPDGAAEMAANLAEAAWQLARIRRQTGRPIRLALEPEPDCCLETTDEAVAFFTGPLARTGADHLRRRHGARPGEAEAALREHLGICLDTAHAAVEFEDPADSLARLEAAGVPVAKVQLSVALEARPSAEGLRRLRDFCDPVYLHQVKARGPDGTVRSHRDLPEALAAAGDAGDEERWRVHFHVPLFWPGDEALASTRECLTDGFFGRLAEGACPHLEIETYTFDVLPADVRPSDVTESIAREYRWVLGRLGR